MAFRLCEDQYKLTEEEKKKSELSVFYFFLTLTCFDDSMQSEYCIKDKTTAECEAMSVHALFAALGSGVFFIIVPLFSQQRK